MEENRKNLLKDVYKVYPDLSDDYKILISTMVNIKDRSDRYAVENLSQLLSTVKYILAPTHAHNQLVY